MAQFFNLYLALGANLGDRESTLRRALELLTERVGEIKQTSSFYNTAALNPPNIEVQPDFLNAAVWLLTAQKPEAILEIILKIEAELGRNRAKELHWGPRTIDIDILALDNLIFNSPRLTIPHPEMHKRRFVLEPLAEIAPDFVHPKLRLGVGDMLRGLSYRVAPLRARSQ